MGSVSLCYRPGVIPRKGNVDAADPFPHEEFLAACILMGCDYGKTGINKAGPKKIAEFIGKSGPDVERISKCARFSGLDVDVDFVLNFSKALFCFRHQSVYDPDSKTLKPRRPLPGEAGSEEVDHTGDPIAVELLAALRANERDLFVGWRYEANIAAEVASGKLHPVSKALIEFDKVPPRPKKPVVSEGDVGVPVTMKGSTGFALGSDDWLKLPPLNRKPLTSKRAKAGVESSNEKNDILRFFQVGPPPKKDSGTEKTAKPKAGNGTVEAGGAASSSWSGASDLLLGNEQASRAAEEDLEDEEEDGDDYLPSRFRVGVRTDLGLGKFNELFDKDLGDHFNNAAGATTTEEGSRECGDEDAPPKHPSLFDLLGGVGKVRPRARAGSTSKSVEQDHNDKDNFSEQEEAAPPRKKRAAPMKRKARDESAGVDEEEGAPKAKRARGKQAPKKAPAAKKRSSTSAILAAEEENDTNIVQISDDDLLSALREGLQKSLSGATSSSAGGTTSRSTSLLGSKLFAPPPRGFGGEGPPSNNSKVKTLFGAAPAPPPRSTSASAPGVPKAGAMGGGLFASLAYVDSEDDSSNPPPAFLQGAADLLKQSLLLGGVASPGACPAAPAPSPCPSKASKASASSGSPCDFDPQQAADAALSKLQSLKNCGGVGRGFAKRSRRSSGGGSASSASGGSEEDVGARRRGLGLAKCAELNPTRLDLEQADEDGVGVTGRAKDDLKTAVDIDSSSIKESSGEAAASSGAPTGAMLGAIEKGVVLAPPVVQRVSGKEARLSDKNKPDARPKKRAKKDDCPASPATARPKLSGLSLLDQFAHNKTPRGGAK